MFNALIAQATPAPSCRRADAGPYIESVVSPEFPSDAADIGLGPAHSVVTVSVGANGRVSSVEIRRSSGNLAVDNATRIHPAGWVAALRFTSESGLCYLGNGRSDLVLYWHNSDVSLDEYVADVSQPARNVEIVESGPVKLCAVGLSGWHVLENVEESPGKHTIREEVFMVKDGAAFEAYFHSKPGDMPEGSVRASLLTLCPH